MAKVLIAGIFALVMVNIGVQLVKSPEKGLAGLLNHAGKTNQSEEFDIALRQIASSKILLNAFRVGGWMMIGCAFYILYDSLF
jgi:hypothetical protein